MLDRLNDHIMVCCNNFRTARIFPPYLRARLKVPGLVSARRPLEGDLTSVELQELMEIRASQINRL